MTADDATLRPGARARVGPGRGRRRRARDGAAARLRERDRVRHGRHDREGVADRERRRLARPRVRGRRLALGRQPADARRRRAAADPDDRHRRGRRGRRLDRVARPGGRPAGRARAAPAPRPGRRATAAAASEPTVTDANVFLGYIPDRAARRRPDLRSRASSPSRRSSASPSRSGSRPLEAAAGIHAIANARMTRALRSVSSEKGRDPREFALIAYGGAGPGARGRPRRGARLPRRCSCPRSPGSSARSACSSRGRSSTTCAPCHLDARTVDPARARRDLRRARRSSRLARRRRAASARAELRYGGQTLGDRGRAAAGPVDLRAR